MSYTSTEAVQAVLARNSEQYDSTAAGLDVSQLEEAIKSAEAEIDAKLGLQYKVPFDDFPDTPPLIKEIARDIAAYLADLTYRQDTDYTSENEPMLLRHSRAQTLLELVQLGSIILQGAQPGETPDKPFADLHAINGYQGTMFSMEDFDLGTRRREYYPYTQRTEY